MDDHIKVMGFAMSTTDAWGRGRFVPKGQSKSLFGINKVAMTLDTWSSHLPKNTSDSLAMAFVCNPHYSRRWKLQY